MNSLRAHGLPGTIAASIKRPLASTAVFRERVEGQRGLEIGGPSAFFRTFLPIYKTVASLDNCVFANTTMWEGAVKESFEYTPSKPPGRNYISDGTALNHVADAAYDFILSCHSLEHIANPIRALKEWIRVTRPGGCIVLVVPDHRRTFDHSRPPTSLEHMLDDFGNNVGEDDQTHLAEILERHDLRKDPSAGNWTDFRERSLKNLQMRALHHHVFNTRNTQELLTAVGLEVKVVETALPHHIAVLSVVADDRP